MFSRCTHPDFITQVVAGSDPERVGRESVEKSAPWLVSHREGGEGSGTMVFTTWPSFDVMLGSAHYNCSISSLHPIEHSEKIPGLSEFALLIGL